MCESDVDSLIVCIVGEWIIGVKWGVLRFCFSINSTTFLETQLGSWDKHQVTQAIYKESVHVQFFSPISDFANNLDDKEPLIIAIIIWFS